jgi:hypothetical protein
MTDKWSAYRRVCYIYALYEEVRTQVDADVEKSIVCVLAGMSVVLNKWSEDVGIPVEQEVKSIIEEITLAGFSTDVSLLARKIHMGIVSLINFSETIN